MPTSLPKSASLHSIVAASLMLTATAGLTSCGESKPREPDLPRQEDRWVSEVPISSNLEVKYVGKTRELVITSVSEVRTVDGGTSIRVGQTIEGVTIGAIRCSFHWRDASYGGEQYMWRGKWACQAGRSQDEIERAVGEDGEKRFDYIYVVPVDLQ